jgi:hypothetical protein
VNIKKTSFYVLYYVPISIRMARFF